MYHIEQVCEKKQGFQGFWWFFQTKIDFCIQIGDIQLRLKSCISHLSYVSRILHVSYNSTNPHVSYVPRIHMCILCSTNPHVSYLPRIHMYYMFHESTCILCSTNPHVSYVPRIHKYPMFHESTCILCPICPLGELSLTRFIIYTQQ